MALVLSLALICWTALPCVFSATQSDYDFSPRFRNRTTINPVTISEDAPPGTVVHNFYFTDGNGDVLAFAVVTPGAPFEFDLKSLFYRKPNDTDPLAEYFINLIVTDKTPGLDYETNKELNVTLAVSDEINTDTFVLKLKILNVNDNKPYLNVTQDSITVNEESSTGTPLNYNFSYGDVDFLNGLYIGLQGADSSYMNMDPATGKITLNSFIDVDPSTPYKVFKPVLFVSDGKFTTTATITLTIRDINDNPPVCSLTTYPAEITEEEKGGRLVTRLNCTDRDSSLNGNNQLNYTIIQGNLSLFGISQNGEFSVLSPLDYETKKSEIAVIRVEDSAVGATRFSTTVTVSITIKPTNDIWPEWGVWTPALPQDSTYSVFENASVGTSVFTATATDRDIDEGSIVTYSMIVTVAGSGQRTNALNMDPITGLVTTASALERDGTFGVSGYTAVVQASDGVHVINKTVNIIIKDVNENTPTFSNLPLPIVTWPEERAQAGSDVTKVSATDLDADSTNLTFSVSRVLSGGTSLSMWKFSTVVQGQLELAAILDLDVDNPPSPVQILELTVRDNGYPELTGTATLTVNIIPDNEFSPMIVSQPGATVVQVAEDVPLNTRVTRVVVQDKDKGPEGTLLYSIIGGNVRHAFGIDSEGWISTQATLNRDTLSMYELTVTISDSGTNARTATASVTIEVTYVNNTLTCSPQFQAVNIPENSKVNTIVAYITCARPSSNSIVISTVKPPASSVFGISPPKPVSTKSTSHELILQQAVDYDSSTQSYFIEIEFSDGRSIFPVKVDVTVTAVNEFSPVFQTNPTVSIAESSIQNPVLVYTATDQDYSPHDIATYIISSVSNGGTGLFSINYKSGNLNLISPLDYEALPAGDKTYRVVVVAEDGGGLKGTGTVTVSVTNVNDNYPVCAQLQYAIDVSERQTGQPPYTILSDLGCSDLEDGKNLIYLMTQTPGAYFSVTNGRILLNSNSLDYETSTKHTLTITIADSGQPSLTSTVTVNVNVLDVNEGAPVFSQTTPVSISEAAVIGTFVASVTAVDPDGNDVVYSITGGDTSQQFDIDGTSGRITTRKKLDFESVSIYNLTIQAKERLGDEVGTTSQTVNVINVNDEAPVCKDSNIMLTVLESEPVNYTVTDVACADNDAGTALKYSIVSGNTALFKMEGSKLKLKAQLDFEQPPLSHDLVILVSDSEVTHDARVTITVTTGSVDEGPPRFDKDTYVVHIPENAAVYSTVTTLKASDLDSPSDQNGQVKYSFTTPYPLFDLNFNSGQITLIGNLDREKEALHKLTVRASDALGSNTATVSVIVDDVNDNAPRFKSPIYRAVISNEAVTGTKILKVEATDADDPNVNDYGSVHYRLAGSSDFRIDETTGDIFNTVHLDVKNGSRVYDLNVTAFDSGGRVGYLISTCLVTIHVTSVNQYAPVCGQSTYSMTVQENQFTIGDLLLSVSATDDDGGPDGEVTMRLVSSQGKFYLTQNRFTGDIRLQGDLAFDEGDTAFIFDIVVTDKGIPPLTGTCTVVIKVDDMSDNPPLCTPNIILDKLEGETILTQMVCSAGTSNLNYAVLSTKPNSIQPAVSGDGLVTTSPPLDYERSQTYDILIKVNDKVTPAMNTDVTIQLFVIDINDNDPTFRGPLTFELREQTPGGGKVLFTVVADGNDGPTDNVTFSLSDTTYFHIKPETGDMRLIATAPDYETMGALYKVLVCAQDTPNPVQRTSCANVTVNIKDVNDESPQFTHYFYQSSIAEDTSPGVTILTVTAVDKDVSSEFRNISYSIATGNDEACFRVLSSGALEIIKKVDYERTQSYLLSIQASDGDHNASADCYIEVLPVNEFAPAFSVPAVTVRVEENSPLKTFVYKASATDSDSGVDGQVRYSIATSLKQNIASNLKQSPFVIDSTSGDITVGGRLDREITPMYLLTVQAADLAATPKTGTLQLTITVDDVNDNAPNCGPSPLAASVEESAVSGDVVVALTCVDVDDDPAGLNNATSYTIVSGRTDKFAVDQSGRVIVHAGATLDRETEPFYTLTVAVSDLGIKLKLTTTVTINIAVLDVNDNTPYFTSLMSITVSEDTLPGSTLGRVNAEDKDEGVNSQLVYSIVDGDTDNHFSLDPISGHLVLKKPLDFESEEFYLLLIMVKDGGSTPRSVHAILTVIVTDVNDYPPVCANSRNIVKILENSTNEYVTSVICIDLDMTGILTYNITNGNDGNFTINTTTGIIKTQIGAQLDFETVRVYDLEVTAFDGIHSDVAYIRVEIQDVNEFPPVFVPPGTVNITVPEDTGINSLVYEFRAVDKDTADPVKLFSIVSGNLRQKFVLGNQTGRLQLQKSLDYENETSYTLTVKVKDSGGLSSTTELIINVIDVNDNTPVCSDKSVTVTLPEGITSDNVYVPSCYDADKVASPVLSYSLTDQVVPSFSINNRTGQLSLVLPLDYELETTVNLRIMIREKDIPWPRETSVDVKIIVSPVNEHDPVFQPSNVYGPYNVPEDAAVGAVVAQVTAGDLDKGSSDGTVRFIISAGDPGQYFRIDEMNGDIQVIRTLSRKSFTDCTLIVTARDGLPGSNNSRSATATVTLHIIDVNDHRPVLVPPLYWVNVSETSPYGASIVLAHFIVEDVDEGNNGATSVIIVSGNTENKFAIADKDLILVGPLDYETTTFYDLLLEISDAGQPSLKSSGRVKVKVLPVNEQAPRMEVFSASVTIPENSQLGALVFDANATDADSGTDGQISYSIDGNSMNKFIINPATGQLFVNGPLDYDTQPNSFMVIIRATDGAGASDSVTSTVSLRVILSDVNDHVPKFNSSVVVMKVVENIPIGTVVGVIKATDQDSGMNGQVRYNLTGGNGDKTFAVNPTSGLVTTAGTIDYEVNEVYHVTVTASDGGTPTLTSNCLIKVEVTNINDNYPTISPQHFETSLPATFPVGETVLVYSSQDLDTDIGGFTLSNSKHFVVDETKGIVRTIAPLDRDMLDVIVLYIQVKDKGTEADSTIHTATATLTIFVKDSNASTPVVSVTVPENIPVGEIIVRINTTDPNESYNYNIVEGNFGGAFSVDSQGFVKVAKSLDRETVSFYSLNVEVKSQATTKYSTQTKVHITVTDVNDCEPIFSQQNYSFVVAENSSVGLSVGEVRAADADIGPNARLTYTFESFSAGQASHFTLHPSTGVITVATSSLDRDLIPSYVAIAKAVDGGSPTRSGFTTISITIIKSERPGPVFQQSNYSATLFEESEPGTLILQVSAQDTSNSVSGTVSYMLDTVNLDGPIVQNYIKVNKTSGEITTTGKVDYEKHHLFRVSVIAVSNDNPNSSGTTSVVISINDINDNNPVFSQSFYNTEVAHTGECTNIVTMAEATDADSGSNGAIRYTLQPGANNNLFSVASNTGEVTLQNTATPWVIYKLEIQAQDSGSPIRVSKLPAKIRVDPFVPKEVVIIFKLGIGRVSFMSTLKQFLQNLEEEIHTKYPLALPRVWCVVEYEGVAVTVASNQRKLLADMPVDVRVYALRDNSTDSEDNINKVKDFIRQDELMILTSNITGGPDGNGDGDTRWKYINVISITPYDDDPEIFLTSSSGRIIIAFAILIGLILLLLLLFMLLRYCCPGAKKSKKRREELEMVEATSKIPISESGSRFSKASFQDTDSFLMMYPAYTYYLPDLPELLLPDQYFSKSSKDTVMNKGLEELSTSSITISSAPSTIRGAKHLSIKANNEGLLDDYKVYDGLAHDPATGKLYEFSSDTKDRHWLN